MTRNRLKLLFCSFRSDQTAVAMARRQAAPKPEELIQKLEEKLDEFKEEIKVQLEEQSNKNEETTSSISDIKEKQAMKRSLSLMKTWSKRVNITKILLRKYSHLIFLTPLPSPKYLWGKFVQFAATFFYLLYIWM